MTNTLSLQMIFTFILTLLVTLVILVFLVLQQRKERKKTWGSDERSQLPKLLFVASTIFSVLFVFLIWVLGPLLQRFELGPDLGASHYYWQLPVSDSVGQLVVWGLYLTHQISLWILIYWGQKNYTKLKSQAETGLTTYNWIAVGINGLFIYLHLLQTHLFYDGLAQDVPIWTSQGSVIIMLAFLLIMQNRQRGLLLGKKMGRPFTQEVTKFFRNSHMYIFSWALAYTFWFHPMDSDPQLLTGFIYMFLLFTQISLAYTNFHLNRKWIILLESFVAIHAVVVAVNNTLTFSSSDMWPMFLSGFTFMVVMTYLFGLRMSKQWRWVIFGLFASYLLWLYFPIPFGYGRDVTYFFRMEVLWIPIVLYGLAILFAGIIYLYLKIFRKKDSNIANSFLI
ncbi:MAG: hypothetical protein ACXABU_15385 [Candidatus Hodarchaeales archaeon]